MDKQDFWRRKRLVKVEQSMINGVVFKLIWALSAVLCCSVLHMLSQNKQMSFPFQVLKWRKKKGKEMVKLERKKLMHHKLGDFLFVPWTPPPISAFPSNNPWPTHTTQKRLRKRTRSANSRKMVSVVTRRFWDSYISPNPQGRVGLGSGE